MKTTRIVLPIVMALLLAALSACQSVPAERKNNCACLWETPSGMTELLKGANA